MNEVFKKRLRFFSKIINKIGRELMATILTPLTNVRRLETNDEVKWWSHRRDGARVANSVRDNYQQHRREDELLLLPIHTQPNFGGLHFLCFEFRYVSNLLSLYRCKVLKFHYIQDTRFRTVFTKCFLWLIDYTLRKTLSSFLALICHSHEKITLLFLARIFFVCR